VGPEDSSELEATKRDLEDQTEAGPLRKRDRK
jgi:hypothetical protein